VEYVRRLLDEVMQAARRGARLARGMTVVIAGRPNAGKSTLLNQLAGYDAAIVTPVPGTTRDPLRVTLDINGVPVELIDTAGLRDLPASVASATDDIDSANAIEAEGMRRAREAIARADCVLYLVDAAADPEARSFEAERSSLPEGVQVMLVMNKSDLVEGASHPVNMAATSPLHACEVAPPRISAGTLLLQADTPKPAAAPSPRDRGMWKRWNAPRAKWMRPFSSLHRSAVNSRRSSCAARRQRSAKSSAM
jgi:tRNA modification GTPase